MEEVYERTIDLLEERNIVVPPAVEEYTFRTAVRVFEAGDELSEGDVPILQSLLLLQGAEMSVTTSIDQPISNGQYEEQLKLSTTEVQAATLTSFCSCLGTPSCCSGNNLMFVTNFSGDAGMLRELLDSETSDALLEADESELVNQMLQSKFAPFGPPGHLTEWFILRMTLWQQAAAVINDSLFADWDPELSL